MAHLRDVLANRDGGCAMKGESKEAALGLLSSRGWVCGEFGGVTFQPGSDGRRLRRQLVAVWQVMQDRAWHQLPEIVERLKGEGVKATTQSVSARIRDLRKEQFGAHMVIRRRVAGGVWEYRLVSRIEYPHASQEVVA